MVPTTTTKLNSLEELATINSLNYKGDMAEYQQEGNSHKGKKYVEVEITHLSAYQTDMYKRALHGLNLYSKAELKKMHWDRKRRIKRVNKRAQLVLNSYKQMLTNLKANAFLENFFPNSPIVRDLKDEELNGSDATLINNFSIKDMGLSRDNIISIFMQEGILPKNFYELKDSV